jgi:zinc/manganese transport system permease protein
MPEAIHFFSVQITLVAIVLVLHTYLGLHVIRRTLIFSDLVLDQLAALGALVGIGFAVRYGSPGSYLMSLAAVLVGSLLLAVLKPRSPMVPREAVIGIL